LTENSLPSPIELQSHLRGVHYPATRNDLLAHAQRECQRITGTLSLLPAREYSRPTDVSKAFGEVMREAIAGADYPADRAALVNYAHDQGAEMVIIDPLTRIPGREYDSPDAVVIEVVDVL
jgi:hypothetical protein